MTEIRLQCSTDNMEVEYDEQGMPWIVEKPQQVEYVPLHQCSNCGANLTTHSCWECGWF